MRLWTETARARRTLADDSGIALLTVVSVAVIIFLLLTTVLTLSIYHDSMSARYTARTRAMHMADAGINAYLYELKRLGKGCLTSNPTLESTMQDGSWKVTVTNDDPITLEAIGTITGPKPTTRKIVATVRYPTFADYAVVIDRGNGSAPGYAYGIGSGATFYGKIRANYDIDNAGRITGKATAGGRCLGSGLYDGGKQEYAPKVDFATVTADVAGIRSKATANGTFLQWPPDPDGPGPAPAGIGYQLKFTGTSAQVFCVNSENSSTGNLNVTSMGTLAIPADGVIFVDDTVWISGTYATKVTVASSDDVVIADDVRPADPDSDATMGIIAYDPESGTTDYSANGKGDILFPFWYQSMPQNMTVQAALLSQDGGIGQDGSGTAKSSLTLIGSRAQLYQIGFSSGWTTRNFYYDPRLEMDPPPSYPELKVDSLKVSTWIEQ